MPDGKHTVIIQGKKRFEVAEVLNLEKPVYDGLPFEKLAKSVRSSMNSGIWLQIIESCKRMA